MKQQSKTMTALLAAGMVVTLALAASGCKKDQSAAPAAAEHPSVEKAAEHPAADAPKEHPAEENPAAAKPKDHPAH